MRLRLKASLIKKAYFFEAQDLATKARFRKAFIEWFDETYLTSYGPEVDPVFLTDPVYLDLTQKWKQESLAAIDAVPRQAFPITEQELDLSWIETSDAFQMAEEGDYSGYQDCFDLFINSLERLF